MIKYLPLAFLFIVFLIPIATDDGISINYSFVTFPFLFLIFKKEVHKPANFIVASVLIFIVIFIIGLFFIFFRQIDLISRSVISFLIFISVFSFSLVPIKINIVISFKIAIIITAVLFSFDSMYKFIRLSTDDLGLIKELIGSQRIGFIHTMAIFLLIIPQQDLIIRTIYRNFILIFVLIGLILTFSRTPVIAVVLTYLILNISTFKFNYLLNVKWYKTFIIGLLSLILLIFMLYLLVPELFLFFNERLIERFFLNSSEDAFLNPDTSEGTRVEIWRTILNYCLSNPFHGSGYLGAYVLEANIVFGSSHSQYMDVFLRTGFVGIIVYMYLIYIMSKEIYIKDKSLFWGFISILLYGLFHETFKESQGGFIFSFLLGFTSYHYSKGNSVYK